MTKVRAALSLLAALVLLCAGPLPVLAQDNTALFEAAYAAWLSPKEAALQSGTYTLRTGGGAYVPCVAPEITPYDQKADPPSSEGCTFASADPQVVSVDASGWMTGVAAGEATVTCTMADGTAQSFAVTVSDSVLPEAAKAFVYVVRREFLKNQQQRLPKANPYTIWYYHSKKEVGWCSVFTIWCANASGTNPIDEKDAVDIPADRMLLLREGQVGNQYDGFSRNARFVGIPRPGYLVIYANMKNTYLFTHIGIVTDVQDAGGGFYQVTTVEGNMSNTVKCYTYLYDSNADNSFLTPETRAEQKPNMSVVPLENQTDPLTQYELSTDTWTVFGFCATWL